MKVICIENNLMRLPNDTGENICVGKTYTVKEVVNWYGREWYVLEGFKSGWGWNPKCFMPLESKFDEMLRVCLSTKPLKSTKRKNLITQLHTELLSTIEKS